MTYLDCCNIRYLFGQVNVFKKRKGFNSYIWHIDGPKRTLPLRGRVDLGVMAIKVHSTLQSETSPSDIISRISISHIQDTRLGVLPLCSWRILYHKLIEQFFFFYSGSRKRPESLKNSFLKSSYTHKMFIYS